MAVRLQTASIEGALARAVIHDAAPEIGARRIVHRHGQRTFTRAACGAPVAA